MKKLVGIFLVLVLFCGVVSGIAEVKTNTWTSTYTDYSDSETGVEKTDTYVETIDTDAKTKVVNVYDESGTLTRSETYTGYDDDSLDYEKGVTVCYNKTGKVESEATFDSDGNSEEKYYYESGALKSVSTWKNDGSYSGKQYNENGSLYNVYTGDADSNSESVFYYEDGTVMSSYTSTGYDSETGKYSEHEHKHYREDGSLYSEYHTDENGNEKGIYYNENGTKSGESCRYANNDYEYTYYNENGVKISEGSRTGYNSETGYAEEHETSYYEDGSIERVRSEQNGAGQETYYYENGQISSTRTFSGYNSKTGEYANENWEDYYEDGSKSGSGYTDLSQGKRVNRSFYEDGSLFSEEISTGYNSETQSFNNVQSTSYYNDGTVRSVQTETAGGWTRVRYNEDGSVRATTEGVKNGNLHTSVTKYTTGETGYGESDYAGDENGYTNYDYGATFDADGNLVAGYYYFDEGKYDSEEYTYVSYHYDAEANKWVDEKGNEVSAPFDVDAVRNKLGLKLKTKTDAVWYPDNTAGVIGISLRDIRPELTDKWYNVLPVDLSQDGTQSFHIVASNLYYMGSVVVTVNGDEVTTEYHYLNEKNISFMIYPKEECLMWFRGLDEITTEFLENPVSEMKFGEPISIEKDLGGQKMALLFVRNKLTYRVPMNISGATPIRFWRNHYKMADYFSNAESMLEEVEKLYAESRKTE